MVLNNKQFKTSLYFFIFSLVIIIFFIIIDSIIYQNNLNKNLMNHAQIELKKKNTHFREIFKEQENLLQSIRNSSHFKKYLKNQDQNEYIEDMNEFFSIISSNKKNIMKLRYIGKNGLEKLKITKTKNDALPVINNKNKLEDKKDRYYFQKSKNNTLEKVWFSNLDLNIEKGKVQIPFKATLRAVLPIKKDGEFTGILIVNYFMDNLINILFESTFFDMILINKKGYPLFHHETSKNWGYYKETKYSIKEEFPKNYERIVTGKMIEGENFISSKLSIPTLEQLILIIKIKKSFTQRQHNDNLKQYLLVSLIVIVVALIISIVFSNYIEKLFSILDNTKRINKLLDEKINEKTKKLKESNEKLSNIIENINDFIWEVDTNWKFTYLSPQIKNILGFEPRELIGKTPLDLIDKNEVNKVKSILDNIMKSKSLIVQLGTVNLHKDNKTKIHLEASGTPILDENGILTGYRGTNRDNTLRKKQENEIKIINQKLENANHFLEDKIQEEIEKNKIQEGQLFNQAKLAAMGDMIGNIAHQWRQPLNFISVVASGIKLDQEFGVLKKEEIPKTMNDIISKTQYLSKTIDTFRDFLKEKKEYKEVIIQDRIAIALNIVEASIKDNHIEIINKIDYSNPIKCFIVKSELAEVIINIFNNAKDVLLENKIEKPWIKIELEEKENHITISIEDNAKGIPEDIINRIFEPYFTTKESSKGTGLGLYMSHKIIVESLKGKLYVNNTDNGAKFFIEIPRKKVNNNK